MCRTWGATRGLSWERSHLSTQVKFQAPIADMLSKTVAPLINTSTAFPMLK